MLAVCTFFWGSKYSSDYVERLAAGVRRHLKQPHRFLCMTEREREVTFSSGIERHAIKDPELIGRGCFARLRLFDPEWQQRRHLFASGDGLAVGDRIVCLDLDNVITGPLDPLFDRPEPFVIFQGANVSNPNPYNCSLFMLRAGAHPEVWSDFSLDAADNIARYDWADDQGWLAVKVPNAAGWPVGPKSGVYGFGKKEWPFGEALPKDARIVAFFGKRDPSQFTHLDWVKENWRL